MADENKIDFGEWKVPSSWDDITLKQFQEINRYYADKERKFDVRDVIDILTDKTMDEINQLPVDFLDIMFDKMSFLTEEPKADKPSNKIVIDNEEYQINVMEKLKTGEYVSVDAIMKGDRHDYASILAVLCRKKGEIYDSKFEAELFEERKKMFEEQPITKIIPLVGFFLNCLTLSVLPSQLYSQVEEAINLTRSNISSSTKIGAFRKRYLNWQVRKLEKLLKSNRNTSQTHSSSLLTSLKNKKWKMWKTSGKSKGGKQRKADN